MSIFSEKSLFIASSQLRSPDVLAWKMIARHHYEVYPTGGSHRVFRQFLWLEVGSGKVALSRPAHQRQYTFEMKEFEYEIS